jgi:hypothetical protein
LEAIMAKNVYQWTGEGETRALTVTNLQTKASITIPAAKGIARVTGLGTHGARTNDELLVVKIVADMSGDIARIKSWLDGPDRGAVVAEYEQKFHKQQAEIAELRAELARMRPE